MTSTIIPTLHLQTSQDHSNALQLSTSPLDNEIAVSPSASKLLSSTTTKLTRPTGPISNKKNENLTSNLSRSNTTGGVHSNSSSVIAERTGATILSETGSELVGKGAEESWVSKHNDGLI